MNNNTAIVILVLGGMLTMLIAAIFLSDEEQNHNTVQIWRMKDPDRPYKGYFDPSRNLFVTCSGTFLDMTEEQLEKEYGSCK